MKIDDREHDLIQQLKNEAVTFDIERLPLGDIIIEHNSTTAIIERKRTDDFAASITDGRWREQKARLKVSGAIVIYLIEGSLYGQSKPPSTLSSAIWNTMLRDKLWVIQTRDLVETSLHIQQLEKKIGTTIKSSSSMVSLLSKRKRKVDNAWLLMLMSIPSISERIATVLVHEYPTLIDLQVQLRTDANQLLKLKVTEKRKVGKNTIKYLTQYLIEVH